MNLFCSNKLLCVLHILSLYPSTRFISSLKGCVCNSLVIILMPLQSLHMPNITLVTEDLDEKQALGKNPCLVKHKAQSSITVVDYVFFQTVLRCPMRGCVLRVCGVM